MKNILLLKGGGYNEHDISLISAEYIKKQIDSSRFKVIEVEITKDFQWLFEGKICQLNFNKELTYQDKLIDIDLALPCIHGKPGETGNLQSYFELIGLPYFGCGPEASSLCFNKLATKLMLDNIGIRTTPFVRILDTTSLEQSIDFLAEHKECYLKATNQGSSVGCYHIKSVSELKANIEEAFSFSSFVILEKAIKGRELEVSAFEYNGEVIITPPGEIKCSSTFYSFEEKYSSESKTQTLPIAKNISNELSLEIQKQAKKAFIALRLRHLSRIDFFLSDDQKVYINEINTFPGHTEISMFPMMMEAHGIQYRNFLTSHLDNLTNF